MTEAEVYLSVQTRYLSIADFMKWVDKQVSEAYAEGRADEALDRDSE